MILEKISNLDKEVKLFKTKQFSGSSNVPEPFTYQVNLTQSFSRGGASGLIAIKFTSNYQTTPIISFKGSILINNEQALSFYNPDRQSNQSSVEVNYDVGLGLVRFSSIQGSMTEIDENTAFLTILWTERHGNSGSAVINGILYTSSEGEVEVLSEVY